MTATPGMAQPPIVPRGHLSPAQSIWAGRVSKRDAECLKTLLVRCSWLLLCREGEQEGYGMRKDLLNRASPAP